MVGSARIAVVVPNCPILVLIGSRSKSATGLYNVQHYSAAAGKRAADVGRVVSERSNNGPRRYPS